MKRLVSIFSLILILTIASTVDALAKSNVWQKSIDSLEIPQNNTHSKYALYEVKRTENSHDAVLDNSTQTMRTAGSRPVRIISTFGVSNGPATAVQHYAIYLVYTNYGKSLRTRVSAPIRPCASVRYYVFSLNHIIC